jgi:hypothetical protein
MMVCPVWFSLMTREGEIGMKSSAPGDSRGPFFTPCMGSVVWLVLKNKQICPFMFLCLIAITNIKMQIALENRKPSGADYLVDPMRGNSCSP